MKVPRTIIPSGAPCRKSRRRNPKVIIVVIDKAISPIVSVYPVVISARLGKCGASWPAMIPPQVDVAIMARQGTTQMAMTFSMFRDFWPRMEYITPNVMKYARIEFAHHRPYRNQRYLFEPKCQSALMF